MGVAYELDQSTVTKGKDPAFKAGAKRVRGQWNLNILNSIWSESKKRIIGTFAYRNHKNPSGAKGANAAAGEKRQEAAPVAKKTHITAFQYAC